MIEKILYQMLGVTMIVSTIVFLWWAHLFGRETKRMMDEVLEKRRAAKPGYTPTASEFNPGKWVVVDDPKPREMTGADIIALQIRIQTEQTYDFSDPAECERFREHVKRTSKNFFIDANGNKIGKDPE